MSSSSNRPEALVFDAYGTLYDVASVTELAEKNFPGHGSRISEVWRQKQLEYTWLLSLMGKYQDFWQVTSMGLRFAVASVGADLEEDAHRELMENYLQLSAYGEVAGALQAMEAQIPLGILSNGSPEMLMKVTQHNRLSPYFKAVISVHALGIFKPAPQVYELAVTELGIPKEKIGFVSSNAWDAAGAKAFGFQVFWINRFKRAQETLPFAPDHEIFTLDDLLPFVE